MNPDQYKKLLEKMGISEDQFKYFTTAKEDLPGLFGFTGKQSERFSEQFGGLPKFDPSKAMQAYGEVERYGEEKTADIGQQVQSGISGVQSGLMSGIQDVVSNVGKGLGRRFGGTQKAISDVMGSAYEAGSDVRRKGTAALSNLAERLGARRAAVGKTAFDYLGSLMNLSGNIFSLDPGSDKELAIEGNQKIMDYFRNLPGYSEALEQQRIKNIPEPKPSDRAGLYEGQISSGGGYIFLNGSWRTNS